MRTSSSSSLITFSTHPPNQKQAENEVRTAQDIRNNEEERVLALHDGCGAGINWRDVGKGAGVVVCSSIDECIWIAVGELELRLGLLRFGRCSDEGS